jgi:hypothetical protein
LELFDVTATAFLTRVVLRNYKSIATCDVALGPLTSPSKVLTP